MQEAIGLCHTCYDSNVTTILTRSSMPICYKCKYPKSKTMIDEENTV